MAGSVAAYRKAERALAQARYVVAAIAIIISAGFIWLALSATDEKPVYAHEPIVHNSPLGQGKGIYPGRVAWIHDANATSWTGADGNTYPPYWHSNTCTNQQVVNEMLSKALQALTGRDNDAAAWDAIFKNFNQQMGRGYVGYTPGEKIAIKINFVLMVNQPSGAKPNQYMDNIDDSPQLTIALLKQLTNVVGVSPGNISIGDPQNCMADYWYNMVGPNCPGVVYLTKQDVNLPGRTKVASDYNAPLYWSDPITSRVTGKTQDYIPTHFAQATYFIDFAVFKSHTQSGITLCGKNNYGSLMRTPNQSGYYDMHLTRPLETSGMGHYRAVVDLLGHPKLGGKMLLALIDGLYSGRGWDSSTIKWAMAPFNNDWPSSIFLSQDPVAADSVAFDFMDNEWNGAVGTINGYPQYSGTDDYLHEAALIPDPCSGANYDPNDDGGLTENLGTHEHWNNATDKKYSRNLYPVNEKGIELVTEEGVVGDFYTDGVVDFKDFAIFAAAWGSQSGDANWNPACDISDDIDGVIDELDLAVFCENWLE